MIYVASTIVGLGVGVPYRLLGLRSPAPPVAFPGRLGMLTGDDAVAKIKAR